VAIWLEGHFQLPSVAGGLALLSIFTTPKPFRGHINTIQTNAIRSWMRLRPRPEIILLGDDEGTEEISRELGLHYIPKVERNEFGTPLVSSIFQLAQATATTPFLCYVNADIILMSDFMAAAQTVARAKEAFLMVGRRWMVDLGRPLDFEDSDWEDQLRANVRRAGRLDIWSSIDYLMFPRGAFPDVPPFAIGRGLWDDWLIYLARSRGLAVVNATHDVFAVHQNHDYSHAGGEAHVFKGEEAQRNLELARRPHLFCIADATHVLRHGRVKPARGFFYLWRQLYIMHVFSPPARPLRWLMDLLLRITRPVRRKIGLTL